MAYVTYVGNSAVGGNRKENPTYSSSFNRVQIPNSRSVGDMSLSNKTTSLRANPFNINYGVQNYGVTTKMGG